MCACHVSSANLSSLEKTWQKNVTEFPDKYNHRLTDSLRIIFAFAQQLLFKHFP